MGGGVGTGIGAGEGMGEGAVGIRSDGVTAGMAEVVAGSLPPPYFFWCFFTRKRQSVFTGNFAFQNRATKFSTSGGTASPSPTMQ